MTIEFTVTCKMWLNPSNILAIAFMTMNFIVTMPAIDVNENLGISCRKNQNCIRYDECPNALKIAQGILTTVNLTEKQVLFEKFKQLQCGNFSTEKTVCCDQDNGKTKVCT